MYRISVLVAVTALLAACSSGSSAKTTPTGTVALTATSAAISPTGIPGTSAPDGGRVLKLRDGNQTEAAYRTKVRALFVDNAGQVNSLCVSLKGLTPKEVVAAIQAGTPSKTPAVQQADPDDNIRAAEILLEECARVR